MAMYVTADIEVLTASGFRPAKACMAFPVEAVSIDEKGQRRLLSMRTTPAASKGVLEFNVRHRETGRSRDLQVVEGGMLFIGSFPYACKVDQDEIRGGKSFVALAPGEELWQVWEKVQLIHDDDVEVVEINTDAAAVMVRKPGTEEGYFLCNPASRVRHFVGSSHRVVSTSDVKEA